MSMKYSVFIEPPEGFHPIVEAAGCYCEWSDKMLFLKRHPLKSQGNTWGIPRGKLEKNENPRMAVIREIREEVGLNFHDYFFDFYSSKSRLPVKFFFHAFLRSGAFS